MLTSALAGLTILMIGDSHLTTPNYLIESLHMNLVRAGAQVHTLGVCGTNAADWLKTVPGTCGSAERVGDGQVKLLGRTAPTTPIAELLAKDKPDLLIVVMGDAMAGYDKAVFPKAWIWQQVTALTKAVSKTQTACAWVGPAWGTEGGKYEKTYARVKQVSSFLKNNVAPCDYIDSLTLSKPGEWATTDGQHFTASGYQAWGDAITKTLGSMPVVQGLKSK